MPLTDYEQARAQRIAANQAKMAVRARCAWRLLSYDFAIGDRRRQQQATVAPAGPAMGPPLSNSPLLLHLHRHCWRFPAAGKGGLHLLQLHRIALAAAARRPPGGLPPSCWCRQLHTATAAAAP